MERLFGRECLAQQVGELVSAKVYETSTLDTWSIFGGVGTTEIDKLFVYALDAYCKYDDEEEVLICRTPGEFWAEAGKGPLGRTTGRRGGPAG